MARQDSIASAMSSSKAIPGRTLRGAIQQRTPRRSNSSTTCEAAARSSVTWLTKRKKSSDSILIPRHHGAGEAVLPATVMLPANDLFLGLSGVIRGRLLKDTRSWRNKSADATFGRSEQQRRARRKQWGR